MANNGNNPVSGESPPPYQPKEKYDVAQPASVYTPHPQPAYQQEPNYVVPLYRLRENPEPVDCPFCHRRAMTRVDKEDSGMTYLAGGLLCLFCICLTCLPCMLGWAQNISHRCGACGKQLTHKSHDGIIEITQEARLAMEAARVVPAQQPVGSESPSQK